MEKDFDLEFKSDEELEQALDELIADIGDKIIEEENKPAILNLRRMKQMRFAYAALKRITRDTDAVVSYKLGEPFKSMGSISVEADTIEFYNPEWFAKAIMFSSNIELYPLRNGKVRLTITFHGLTTPLE